MSSMTPMDMEHPFNNSTTRTRCCHNGCFRKLILMLVCIFVAFMAIISIAWHVMDPHDPGFGVTSLSVTKFTVSDSQLRGKYEVGLTFKNPNKKVQVELDSFNVFVLYGKVELVTRDLPKSVQKVVAENMVEEWNKGVLDFNVKLEVRVRFEGGFWPAKVKFLNVYCGNLDVGFFSPKDTGKLLGIGKDCN
ncbi:hypothetical protein RJT34_31038 [Clitoria ternatea]|uniref:Late embryogenesis abundant protein LEA-2 subgroup domain-containing protein n=1 Tax=Clitoria ternatea TaxID=43366 RepID=A0AAN9F1D4_CLITE